MLEPGQQLGPFTVDQQIGRGGMGTVYRARRTDNGQTVALKVMSPRLNGDDAHLLRFEREAAILKQLRHPNIVRLLGTGRIRSSPFIVMEYVDGSSVDRLLQRRGRFGWEEVVRLGGQLCSALQHAHQQGIIHRDLKPANLLLLPDGTVKLTDFGIAKDVDQDGLTASGCAVGTAAYMAPEQCRGERNLSHKADLYALGVVLYELLTGRTPFRADNSLDMLVLHTEGRFERPSRLALDMPIWLDTLVCHLLEKEPDKRPYDATIVARALADVEEKALAQQSAGLDPTQVRRSARVEESDREAARALQAAARGDLRRPSGPPLHERRWVQATGLAAALAGIVGVLYLALRPADPNRLFAEAERAMASTNPDDWDRARQGPLRQYLQQFGGRDDERTRQASAWADRADVHRLERQLTARAKLSLRPSDDGERAGREALQAEEAGNLTTAAEQWRKAAEADSPEQRIWGLLADQRLRRLAEAEAEFENLRKRVEEARRRQQPFEGATDAERLAARALRYEWFGDVPLARRNWQELKRQATKEPGLRAWFLIAGKHDSDLIARTPAEADVPAFRKALLTKQWDEASRLLRDEKSNAGLLLCRDIVDLYSEAGSCGPACVAGDALSRNGRLGHDPDNPTIPRGLTGRAPGCMTWRRFGSGKGAPLLTRRVRETFAHECGSHRRREK
jgi:serine/threonine-protein kinase